MSHEASDHKIGIVEFFTEKTIFITGATGFTGKVFVEKLLREAPTLRKVYLLVRAENEGGAKQRLKTEIINSELFKVVREKYGEAYEKFMWDKLIPIAGDLCKPYFGMNIDSFSQIRNEVNMIVHISGNTKWDERLDISLEVNTMGVSKLADFAIECMKLVLFIHVSTAYTTQGIILDLTFEKPIKLTHGRTNDGRTFGLSIDELINEEMKLISEVSQRVHDEEEQAQEMIKLSMRRSNFYKKYNVYQVTKAMGEMVLVSKLESKIPVVIIRPSQIASTFKEPFPGWFEGYKILDPIILSYGMGKLRGLPAKPDVILDVVPVDMVVNAMISAIGKHGNEAKKGVNIYHVVSSLVNPLSCQEFFNLTRDYFALNPFKDTKGKLIIVKDMKFFDSLSEFMLVGLSGEKSLDAKNQVKMLHMAAIYETILSARGARFDDTNTRRLLGEMSLDESNMFNFNFKCINWKDYFLNIHIPNVMDRLVRNRFLAAKL